MALITDPDLLNQGTEVTINTSAKTITLNEAGALSADGVTLKALYSFLKEEWRADSALIKFDFPMTPITDEQMQIGVSSRNNGWVFGNDATRKLIRTGGWQEVSAAGAVNREYAGIVSLGSLESGTQPYYEVVTGTPVDFTYAGQVNEAVQVYGDASNGNLDYRSAFKIFAREQGDTYANANLADIGVSTMTYQVYRFPLATGSDIKITATDLEIDANTDFIADIAPYSGMSITYYSVAQSRQIGASNYDFGIIIDGNNATAEEIYEFVQWSLRIDGDIDAGSPGTVNGKTAAALLRFVGDTLYTQSATNPQGGGTGVFIDNYNTNDINRLVFTDNTPAERTFPYTATLTLNFSTTLQNDASAKYWVFFTNDDDGDNAGNDFNTSTAILVNDASASPMTGDVSSQATISHTFAYDTNVQRGAASAGIDAPITAVAIGLSGAQYVLATGTIQRSTANSVALVAPQERNYANA